jgi:nitronate monooxygenase
MSLDPDLRAGMVLPAICAPMFLVSGPDLVRQACAAGIMAGIPRHNARTLETFTGWLREIRGWLDDYAEREPGARIGPVAVNLSTRMEPATLDEHLRLCAAHGVKVIISAAGDPTELTKRVHDHGLRVFHDVTSLRFAEKAIAAGVDGMTCIGAGGGGKSGTISLLVFIPKVRQMFGGTIICAGAVTTGAAIRAAELLGADLAYLGTRFIASQESMADPRYKRMLVEAGSPDLRYTAAVGGIPANWLAASMRSAGLDPDAPPSRPNDTAIPATAKPWKTVWSAGQGVDLIHDVPTVAELVLRLRREYVAACAVPDMADVARVLDRVAGADIP